MCSAMLQLAAAFGDAQVVLKDWKKISKPTYKTYTCLLSQADGNSVSKIFQALQQQEGWTSQLAAQALLGKHPLIGYAAYM